MMAHATVFGFALLTTSRCVTCHHCCGGHLQARQRGEDVQRLVSSVLALLDGSGAFSLDSAEVIASTSKVSHDIGTGGSGDASVRDATTAPSPRGDTEAASDQTAKHRHGVLATAQLHSVTLQVCLPCRWLDAYWRMLCGLLDKQALGATVIASMYFLTSCRL
jgi:hypothetical protein